MSAMDLFVSKPVIRFEKTAATAKAASAQLDEDPESWPRQILTELFRSTPETSDYTPQVSMMKVDPEQGYGLGVVLIENTTDSALAAVRSSPNSQRALVPVVVKSHVLLPLDLLMMKNGRMLPLNGHTLREALFRPETFEMTTEDWGDTSLWNQFYPPGRSDNGFGAGISQGVGGGTQGAVTLIQGPGMKLSAVEDYRMLVKLLPTLLGPDLDEVAKTAGQSKQAYDADSAFFSAIRLLALAENDATRDGGSLVKKAAASARPDVVQIGWSPTEDQYWVKMASRSVFMTPRPRYMGRGEALKYAGDTVVAKVDTEGTVTIAPETAQSSEVDPDASAWGVVDKPGIYKVKTVHGKEQVGWVIPNLIDLDGTFVPMAVFTNGASAMVQEQIAGTHVAAGVDLPAGPALPKSTGCFYAAGQGGVQATVPLMIEGKETAMDGGDSFLVRSITGEESRVRLVPGLTKIVVLKGEFHMPVSAKFMPLSDEALTPLIDNPDQVTKTAADLSQAVITLFGGDEDEVSVRFQAMPKLASVTNHRMTHDDAVFLLCLAGADPTEAYTKVAAAASGSTVHVRGMQDVRLASDLIEETHKIASPRSHEVRALRQNLVKEASTLPDAMTVDAVLSLGFINSENVRMFISNLPYLEKCLSKVCELVLASRLGLSEIPEFAAARAARALDEVIQGLKALALRDTKEDTSVG